MDPTTLMQLLAHLRQQGQGQMPQMGHMPPMQPLAGSQMQGQQMPTQQGQLPSMAPPHLGMGGQGMGEPGQDQHRGHGGGFSPWMLMSPLGGLFASNPKGALSMLASPAFGLASMMGR